MVSTASSSRSHKNVALEYRFAALEVRAADGGQIEGTAMPYGREADIAGVFRESVDAGAFGTIGDVILNSNAQPATCRWRAPKAAGSTWTDGAERLFLRAVNSGVSGRDVRDHGDAANPSRLLCGDGGVGRGLADPGQAHHSSGYPVGNRPRGSTGLRRGYGGDRQASEGSMSSTHPQRWPLAV